MNLKEVKNKIIDKSLSTSLLIFKCEKETFIAHQYVKEILKIRNNLEVVYVDSLDDVVVNEFSIFEDNSFYVVVVDKLESTNRDISKLENVVVICSKVDNQYTNEKYSNYIVEVPKLVDWQIQEYLQLHMQGLNPQYIKWLCEITNNDINRLYNEMCKISIFDNSQQDYMFKLINDENGYGDLTQLNIFNFTDAVFKRDKKKVLEILENRESIDLEPAGVVTLLYKNFRIITQLQMNPKVTYEQLGISQKQLNAIKYYNLNHYSNSELVNILELLTSIDYKLKSGLLPYDMIIDYVIDRIL